ncbi:hypothetical protein DVS28_a5019 [Euzebya pacifica]|uniref:Uncharacterized protein n=1 Tax=Euzebya pacifica TaxID=1608957 RepID=A0A346Y5C9_9ACTN|nr:hypothetical protein DVS28_a5019 [Euzebya pacifica]
MRSPGDQGHTPRQIDRGHVRSPFVGSGHPAAPGLAIRTLTTNLDKRQGFSGQLSKGQRSG